VSEQPTARATRPPAARPGTPGKKYAGLTRNQWFIAGGVFAAALAYILWKRHQASTAAASQSPTSAGSNECTDANGNPVDCGELTASELAAALVRAGPARPVRRARRAPRPARTPGPERRPPRSRPPLR
jgi:hypothetical protein